MARGEKSALPWSGVAKTTPFSTNSTLFPGPTTSWRNWATRCPGACSADSRETLYGRWSEPPIPGKPSRETIEPPKETGQQPAANELRCLTQPLTDQSDHKGGTHRPLVQLFAQPNPDACSLTPVAAVWGRSILAHTAC